MNEHDEKLGRSAYDAWAERTSTDKKQPKDWIDISGTIRRRWVAIAQAVLDAHAYSVASKPDEDDDDQDEDEESDEDEEKTA